LFPTWSPGSILQEQKKLASIFQYSLQTDNIPGTKNYFYERFTLFDSSYTADWMAPWRFRI
jgi:hypothetical protein